MSGGTIIMTFGSNKICYSNAYQVIGGKGIKPTFKLMFIVTKTRKDHKPLKLLFSFNRNEKM